VDTLRDIGELGLLERIARTLPKAEGVVAGVGDDCAVVQMGGRLMLVTCDASIEDVHFSRSLASPEVIGWKAAASALSDIAAMGGQARFAVVALGVPGDVSVEVVDELYAGLWKAVQQAGAVVVGGDLTRAPSGVVIDVTVIGEAVDGRYRLRSTARAGDILAITGFPGCSAAGLAALQAGIDAPSLVQAHLHPVPRIAEGQWFSERESVHALIDVSDGAVHDAEHLATASELGIDLNPDSFPVDPALEAHGEALGRAPLDFMLHGGEEYELLAALAPEAAPAVARSLHKRFGIPLTPLGVFTGAHRRVHIHGEEAGFMGYDHFRM